MSTPLSDDIRRFITEHIASLDQLEILAFLRRNRANSWSPEDIAARFRSSASAVIARVDRLLDNGLVAQLQSDPPQYRYETRTPDLDLRVAALLGLYHARTVDVVSEIYARSSEKNWPRKRRQHGP